MGFFDVLKNLATGKPGFEVPETPDEHTNMPEKPVEGESPARRGPKVIPEVEIERTTYRTNGQQMQITCIIQNNSKGTVELDKIRLLGSSLELDSFLRSGEERQYNVYKGNRPNNTNYHLAELYYKDEFGDYFCANHLIEYERESDGTYSITEFKLQHPIRDV